MTAIEMCGPVSSTRKDWRRVNTTLCEHEGRVDKWHMLCSHPIMSTMQCLTVSGQGHILPFWKGWARLHLKTGNGRESSTHATCDIKLPDSNFYPFIVFPCFHLVLSVSGSFSGHHTTTWMVEYFSNNTFWSWVPMSIVFHTANL